MLTALMDKDKLQALRDYAAGKGVSMGWLINRLVDRLLSGDFNVMGDAPSIEIDRDSIDKSSIDIDRDAIEKTVKVYIDNLLKNMSTGVYRESIETILLQLTEKRIDPITEDIAVIKTTIERLEVELVEAKKAIDSGGINQQQSTSNNRADSIRLASTDGGLSVSEVVAKTGRTRQAIEKSRDKNTLSELGYRAEKVQLNWRYYPLTPNY